jgi:hypothetical protein
VCLGERGRATKRRSVGGDVYERHGLKGGIVGVPELKNGYLVRVWGGGAGPWVQNEIIRAVRGGRRC